LATSPYSLVF